MSQLTVRLPEDLSDELESAARSLQRKKSEVVRMALRDFLGRGREGRPAERVRDLLGSLDSGTPDLAENHRCYLLDSLRRDT